MSWEFTEEARKVRRAIYEAFLAEGRSPNVAQIMKATGLSKAQVDAALEELERGVMVVTAKGGLGAVIKAMPWTNYPTPHAIEVEGERTRWYSGCALEAINIPYCHPGKQVTVRSSCPHCADPVTVTLKDDDILSHQPAEAVVHLGVNPVDWKKDWVKGCANINFFPSPEHVRAWEQTHPEFRGATLPLMVAREKIRYTRRLDFERGADGGGDQLLPMLQELGLAPEEWRPAS